MLAADIEKLSKIARQRNSEVFVLSGDGSSPDRGHSSAAGSAVVEIPEFIERFRHIPPNKSIDLILLSRNVSLGTVTRISRLLRKHPGKVTVVVSGPVVGNCTLLALAADEIVIARDAWLSFGNEVLSALDRAARRKGRRHLSDYSLLLLHNWKRERQESAKLACELLHGGRHGGRCSAAKSVASGLVNSSAPARAALLRRWGLNVVELDFFDTIEMSKDSVFNITVFGSANNTGAELMKVLPTCAEACPTGGARNAMRGLEAKRGSKVICIIHANGTRSEMVDGQTAAEALKVISQTPTDVPIDLILHTPGGISIYGEQIARALKAHRARTRAIVPYDAFSAGTIVALAADGIEMSPVASLGPIDTQFRVDEDNSFPASAFIGLTRMKRLKDVSDYFLMLATRARETMANDRQRALELMRGTYSWWTRRRIVKFLGDGHLTHGYPLNFEEAARLGLNVKHGVPDEAFQIVDEFVFDDGNFCSVIHCSA